MAFIDFAELKEKVSFASAIELLDLKLKQAGNQWRGTCPSCGGSDRGLVVTDGRGYYCFSAKAGGDVIGLTAHVLQMAPKDAARELAQRAGIVQVHSTSKGTGKVPSRTTEPESEEGKRGLTPLSYLEPNHDLVVAMGFDPSFCEQHGIGYAPRGVCRGSVALPFRDERGTLLGYIAVEDVTYIPPDFQTNVVQFKKSA